MSTKEHALPTDGTAEAWAQTQKQQQQDLLQLVENNPEYGVPPSQAAGKQPPYRPSFASTCTSLDDQSQQAFLGPSFQYDKYKRQTGPPAGGLANTFAANQAMGLQDMCRKNEFVMPTETPNIPSSNFNDFDFTRHTSIDMQDANFGTMVAAQPGKELPSIEDGVDTRLSLEDEGDHRFHTFQLRRNFGTAERHKSTGPVPTVVWPEACRFFNPDTMDPDFIRMLLWDDSMYIDPGDRDLVRLGLITLYDGKVPQRPVNDPSQQKLDDWLTDAIPTTKIAYVGMKRKYLDRATSNSLKVSRQDWMHLLHYLDFLPSALELMYDNNGGFSSHISYRNKDSDSTGSQRDCVPSAYHFCLKLGDAWPNHEHFIYLRHEFNTGQNAVVLAGTDSRTLCQRLFGRLRHIERTDIFSILAMMVFAWLNQAEENRWELDYQVQDIESRTGYSSMQYRRFEPLSPEQMSLTKDMAQTVDSLAMMVTYMENFIRGISFAMDQHLRFHDLCERETRRTWPYGVSQLQDTLAQYHSQACSKKQQIQTLQGRVAAQINVTNTLIAHRDSRANIELATSMKEDARLMKGISTVTMIFLPATFLATFFSMTFFHIGGSDNSLTFEVSRWIWLYPLCTLPLTLALAYQYGLEEKLRSMLDKLGNRLRPVASEAASDSEAQVEHKDRPHVPRARENWRRDN